MDFYSNTDWSTLLESLKTEDEMDKMMVFSEICNKLLHLTDEEVNNVDFNPLVEEIITILTTGINPDLQLYTCRAVIYLLEANPSLDFRFATRDIVNALSEKLKCMEYIDLGEQIIHVFLKLSYKNYGITKILQADGLVALISFLDFFALDVQLKAMETAANILSIVPVDLWPVVANGLPFLKGLLGNYNFKIVQKTTLCIKNLTLNFANDPLILQSICEAGILGDLIELLVSKTNEDNIQANGTVITNIIYSLSNICRAYPQAVETLLALEIPLMLGRLLTFEKEHGFKDGSEVLMSMVGLADNLLPKTADRIAWIKQYMVSMPLPENVEKQNPLLELYESNESLLVDLGTTLVMHMISTYESLSEVRCLSFLLKLVNLASSEALYSIFMDIPFSSFIAHLFINKDRQEAIITALSLVDMLLEKLPDVYTSLFIREGIVRYIEEQSTPSTTKTKNVKKKNIKVKQKFKSKPNMIENLTAKIKSKYFSQLDVHDHMETLKKLANHLNHCNGCDNTDENLAQTLEDIATYFAKGVSVFELVQSGLLKALISFFQFKKKDRLFVNARTTLFHTYFTKSYDSLSTSPIQQLVTTLLESAESIGKNDDLMLQSHSRPSNIHLYISPKWSAACETDYPATSFKISILPETKVKQVRQQAFVQYASLAKQVKNSMQFALYHRGMVLSDDDSIYDVISMGSLVKILKPTGKEMPILLHHDYNLTYDFNRKEDEEDAITISSYDCILDIHSMRVLEKSSDLYEDHPALQLLDMIQAFLKDWKVRNLPIQANLVFKNANLSTRILKSVQNASNVLHRTFPAWMSSVAKNHPYLLQWDARHAFFKALAFSTSKSYDILKDEMGFNIGTTTNLGKVKMNVHRDSLLKSALAQFPTQYHTEKVVEVSFLNEEGIGLGPTVEFYSLMSLEFQKKSLKLWIDDMNDNSEYVFAKNGLYIAPCLPDSISTSTLDYYSAFGAFIARALLDSRLIDLHLSKAFLQLLKGDTISEYYLSLVFPDVMNTFTQLYDICLQKKKILQDTQLTKEEKHERIRGLTFKGIQIEDLSLYFVLPGYDFELIEHGGDVLVTIDNLDRYLDEAILFMTQRGVNMQLQAIKKGFTQVLGLETIKNLTCKELELMLSGTSDGDHSWAFDDIFQEIVCDHGFTKSSQTPRYIVEIMSEFQPEERRMFLKFVTGSPRLPHNGFKGLSSKLTFVRKEVEPADKYLPSVNTCFLYLKIPDYSSKEVARDRLMVAMKNCQGGFSLS